MGTPAIYWTPRGATAMQRIDLPWITRLDPQPQREARDISPIAGVPLRTDLGGYTLIRIECVMSRDDHASTIRRCRSLQSHVQAGGVFGFSADHALSAGYFTTKTISHGDTSIAVQSGGSPFGAWNNSGALSSGDEVRIGDGNPELREHHDTYSGLSNNTLTINDGSDFSFSYPSLVRYRHFYPVLWPDPEMNDGGILIRHPQHLTTRLVLVAREYPAMLAALHSSADMVIRGDRRDDGALRLDDAIQMFDPGQTGIGGGVASVEGITMPNESRWFK